MNLEVNMVNKEKIKDVLDKLRVSLQADGGDAELVEITDEGLVKLRLQGACSGCPMAQVTLKEGIERALKEHVDEQIVVEEVK
jgi:Fe-S cluster biogenesis protein NfuA